MTADKFFMAFVKSEFLIPKKLAFKATNIYYEMFKDTVESKEKGGIK